MGETSQVTLNWKSHERALKDGIWRFFQSCFMLDTKLRCRGKELKAHKLILSLFSSVLKTKLEEGEEEEETFDGMKTTSGSRETGLVFVDISEMVEQRDDIELLVKFLYTGTVTVPRNRIQSLRNLAEKLDVECLMKVIVDETKETEEKELRTRRTTKVKQKIVEETSDDDDDDNGCDDDVEDDSDGEAEISSNEKKRKVEQVTRVTRSNTKTKGAKIDCEKDETSEFDDSYTSDEDSEDSTKRKRKLKTKKKNVKKLKSKSHLDKSVEDKYSFRPFDDDDEFESDDDENVKPVRDLVERQKEASTGTNFVETDILDDDIREEKFTFDESDDYEERGEIYEWEKKRKLLAPRMNKTRSVKGKLNFVKDRQIFRERVPFMHCEVCDYKTRYLDLIRRHVRIRHVYTPRIQVYHCETCGKTFRVKEMYDLHQLTHENPKEREQKCPKCDYKTSNLFSLKRHLARKHKVDTDGNKLEERFGCSQCEYRCVHPSQLREHVKNRHSNNPMYICDECGFKTRGKSHLELHINSVHREERNFMCEICGYSSKTKGTLTQHKASHNNERKFQCDICGMKFNRASYLKTHVNVHDPNYKPFVCDVCGHKTNRKISLQKHMRRHLPGRVDGRRGRKIGVRRAPIKSRTLKTVPPTAAVVDTTSAPSSSSNSSSCAGPSFVMQPTLDVQTQPYVANQSQPAVYNNNYSYQHSYGMWMCNF